MYQFGKEKRFHDRRDYSRLRNKETTSSAVGPVRVFKLPNGLDHFRLGITVRGRPNSVNRNRIKRQTREFFRTNANRVCGLDIGVTVFATSKSPVEYLEKII